MIANRTDHQGRSRDALHGIFSHMLAELQANPAPATPSPPLPEPMLGAMGGRATHFYAYTIRTERPWGHARLTTHTGRMQVDREYSKEEAHQLIADDAHGARGPFEILEWRRIHPSTKHWGES